MSENDKMFGVMKKYIDDEIDHMEHHLEAQLNDRVTASTELRDELEKRVVESTNLKIQSLKEATELARTTLNIRLDSMNEFRGTLKDQSSLMFTRSEHELYKDKVDTWMKEFAEWKAKQEGKADQSAVNTALLLAIIGTSIGIISLLLGLFGR